MSVHNPFRTPRVTPNPTGVVASNATGSSFDYTRPPSDDLLPEDIPLPPDEPPPAYSSTPDSRIGESSVDFGPRRPFQQAPSTRLQPSPHATGSHLVPQHTNFSVSHLSPQPTGWSAYPGSQHRRNIGASSSSPSLTSPPPPPQHPTSRRRTSVSTSVSPSQQAPVSDFAREFYAAGAGQGGIIPDPEAGGSSLGASQYAPPPGPPPSGNGRYAPPPGRPPSSGKGSSLLPPSSPSRRGNSNVPDDGRPTRTPVPGHPLLSHGNLLVYPLGYECHKCHNTGYKNFDPSHPCSKCWEKYAKPYSGAITYTPWSSSGNATSSSSRNTFQRPLPSFTPPHLSSLSSSSSPSNHHRSQTQVNTSRPSPRPAPLLSFPPTSSPPAPSMSTRYAQDPPPGSLVLPPGDPRIGGRICWRCGGRGVNTFMVFIEDTCEVCGGVGRLFG